MNKKVKILRNRTPYDTSNDLAYFADYMARHGIIITFDVQDTNVSGYTSQYSKASSRWLLEGASDIFSQFTDMTDDACIAMVNGYEEFGNNAPSGSERGIMKNGKTYFCNVEMDYASEPNGLVKVEICHEFMHYLIDDAHHKGFNVIDPMDVCIDENGVQHSYWNNFNPDAPEGNFAEAWKRLAASGYLKSADPVLKLGASGSSVQALQNALGIKADGLFGLKTKAAVTAFQASHGLIADGVVGAVTWSALNSQKKSL